MSWKKEKRLFCGFIRIFVEIKTILTNTLTMFHAITAKYAKTGIKIKKI